jgi:uncharacterized protein (TIGR00661 family)
MKIFYGVQGTGNGHIARARVMAKELYAAGIEVNFLFSGRPADKYFDMEIFNDYQLRTGLTFNTHKGRVNYFKTACQASISTLIGDIRSLDLTGYDLVITDFEPISAWAAKKQKKPTLGISNQYSYHYNIPKKGSDPIADLIMKHFTPVDRAVGLHWHHFGQPILPPITETATMPETMVKNKIVVYLPFEEPDDVIKLLSPFENFEFHVSSSQPVRSKFSHIIYHSMSSDKFQHELVSCAGIISNAGFAMASEALQLGKKILIKPLHAQVEQTSNAQALQQLGYAHVMDTLDVNALEHWLHDDHAVHITYPNTAKILTQWIQNGMPNMDRDFIEEIWSAVDILHIRQ